MNPSELRVGNYVYFRHDTTYSDRENKIADNIFTVSDVDSKSIKIYVGHGKKVMFTERVFEFLKPIEITHNILCDWFGFEHKIKYRSKNRTSDYFLRDDCSKMVQKYRQKYYLQNVTKFDPEALEIKYVHELQNLYFEMTGCELRPDHEELY